MGVMVVWLITGQHGHAMAYNNAIVVMNNYYCKTV